MHDNVLTWRRWFWQIKRKICLSWLFRGLWLVKNSISKLSYFFSLNLCSTHSIQIKKNNYYLEARNDCNDTSLNNKNITFYTMEISSDVTRVFGDLMGEPKQKWTSKLIKGFFRPLVSLFVCVHHKQYINSTFWMNVRMLQAVQSISATNF